MLVTGAGIGEMVLQMLVGLVGGVLPGGWAVVEHSPKQGEKIQPATFKCKLSTS